MLDEMTNARDLYRMVQRKKAIIVTLRNIFYYLQSIEPDFVSFDDAFKVKDSRKQSFELKTVRFINDGRAPDTTKPLLGPEYKKVKQKRKQESEEREAKRLKSLDQSAREDMYNLLFKKLHLSSTPEYILQQYKFNKENFVGRFCPKDDGNCGWRAASLVMFDYENHYYTLKEVMRASLENEQTFFKQLFGVLEYEKLRKKLYQPEGSVNSIHWFDYAVLLATVCKRPVVILVGIQYNTYLPFEERSPVIHTGQVQDVTPIVLHLHLNHFYAFIVKEESIDKIKWPCICPTYKNVVIDYSHSTAWLDIYKNRCHATREDGI
ncbi:hypothetical protein INT45_009925 [Circinella minor]|uniref:OTU domain-containing protein n=1 Tax=Circinella minor TaxID=1195481 RepID=A0A8H7RZT3_9FUNG|nr:hypothetical protein INT45_009925 [Circinella minor]